MKASTKGALYVILSAVIFGCMPLMSKFIYQGGVNAITLVLLRNALALPALAVILAIKKEPMAVTWVQAKKLTLLSLVGIMLTPVLLFSSYNFIPSGMATTVHFVYPVFVLVLCVVFWKEKLSIGKLMCVLLCTAGILAFYEPGQQSNIGGILIAFASGVTFAIYLVYLEKCRLGKMHPYKSMFYMASICSVGLLVGLLATGNLALPQDGKTWLLCVVFSLSLTLGATVLLQVGVQMIGSQKAAILSTFEPITSVVVGVAVFREQLTARNVIGVALILAAVILLTKLKENKNAGA